MGYSFHFKARQFDSNSQEHSEHLVHSCQTPLIRKIRIFLGDTGVLGLERMIPLATRAAVRPSQGMLMNDE